MNWLAHLFLSEPKPAFRIGNLLPDLLDRKELQSLPAIFTAGIQQHRKIDIFTDTHPVVRQSIARLHPPYRRYGGIIVDLFYDHFLAAEWNRHRNVPLDNFLREVYASFESFRAVIPGNAYEVLERMSHEDWLGSYRHMDGVRSALHRIGRRLRKPMPLGNAVDALEAQREAFTSDFEAFFPALRRHVEGCPADPSSH